MPTVADEHFVALGQRGLREHLDAWERSTRAQHGPEVPWVARFSLFSRRAIGSHFAVSWEIFSPYAQDSQRLAITAPPDTASAMPPPAWHSVTLNYST